MMDNSQNFRNATPPNKNIFPQWACAPDTKCCLDHKNEYFTMWTSWCCFFLKIDVEENEWPFGQFGVCDGNGNVVQAIPLRLYRTVHLVIVSICAVCHLRERGQHQGERVVGRCCQRAVLSGGFCALWWTVEEIGRSPCPQFYIWEL